MRRLNSRKLYNVVLAIALFITLTIISSSIVQSELDTTFRNPGVTYAVDEYFIFTHVDVYLNGTSSESETKFIEKEVKDSIRERRLFIFKLFPIDVDVHYIGDYGSVSGTDIK